MKHSLSFTHILRLFFLALAGAFPISRISAQTLYWAGSTTGGTGGVSNIWSDTATNWRPNPDYSGTAQAWTADSSASFAGTPGSVTVSGTQSVQSMSFTGNYTLTSGTIQMTGAGGVINRVTSGNIDIGSGISGSVGLTLNGAGIHTLSGTVKTYTGNTSFGGESTRLSAVNVLPSGTIVTLAASNAGAYIELRANQAFAGLEGTNDTSYVRSHTVGGNYTVTLNRSSGTSVFEGYFSQNSASTINIVKSGDYTQFVSGTSSSTTQGTTLVTAGTLVLNKDDGDNALGDGTGAITLNGGTLRLDQNNQLANSQKLIGNGGTFNLNGRSETLGVFDLDSTSAINLASGTAVFAASNSELWNGTLSIEGSVTGTSLRFGTSSSGLTSGQLAMFSFADYGNVAAQIDSSGYVTPVPEPTTWPLLASGLTALIIFRRRRS